MAGRHDNAAPQSWFRGSAIFLRSFFRRLRPAVRARLRNKTPSRTTCPLCHHVHVMTERTAREIGPSREIGP